MDLFFVLSGFLITGILLDSKGAANYFSSFYMRRVLRIFPVYLVAVGAYFGVTAIVGDRGELVRVADLSLQWWYWSHLSNWISAWGREVGVFSHFWSLSIEEQFYLVWPLLVATLTRRRLLALSCGIVIAAPILRVIALANGLGGEPLHRLTPFRLDALCIGAAIAIFVREPQRTVTAARWTRTGSIVGALLVAVAVLAEGRPNALAPAMTTVGYSGWALLYAAFLLAVLDRTGGAGLLPTVLRSGPLVSLGRYSYALYVVHYPVSRQVASTSTKMMQNRSQFDQALIFAASMIIGIGASYLLSVASWHFLEKHFLRLKVYFTVRVTPVAQGSGLPPPRF